MVDSGNTRQRNLLMLLYALDTAGEATAAHLAEQTGLSVATISRGLSLLKAKKLIVQRRKDTTEVGRRPDVFSINGAYAHCMYCCLDGDALRGYLLDLRGKVVARHGVEATSQMTVADFLEKLAELKQITPQPKIALIGETGTIPSAAALAEEKSQWVSYMTWCGGFVLTEDNTTFDELRAMYHHPWAVTKDKLPVLY